MNYKVILLLYLIYSIKDVYNCKTYSYEKYSIYISKFQENIFQRKNLPKESMI